MIWVAASVAITMVISLGLAQLYNQRFPGRRFARWAIIAPWAASVMMTALIFRWVLQPENGVVNVFLHQLGLVQRFNSNQADWLGNRSPSRRQYIAPEVLCDGQPAGPLAEQFALGVIFVEGLTGRPLSAAS